MERIPAPPHRPQNARATFLMGFRVRDDGMSLAFEGVGQY
jgi:hypothetical protein